MKKAAKLIFLKYTSCHLSLGNEESSKTHLSTDTSTKVFEFSAGLQKHQVELPEKHKDSSETSKLSKTF